MTRSSQLSSSRQKAEKMGMNLALSGLASEEEQDNEDKINAMCEGRKLLKTPATSPSLPHLRIKPWKPSEPRTKREIKSSIARSMSIP